jgi:D-alanine--poly(phosphoribitol) ligase subunit 2
LEEGLIDSLGVMRLVAFLEEEFDVKIPPQDLTIENFITVQAITTYLETINRKKAHE